MPKNSQKKKKSGVAAGGDGMRVMNTPFVNATMSVLPRPSFPDIFPSRRRLPLVYTQTINLASSASASTYGTEVDVNLNSLFLPVSSGSHQPMYFDQLAAIWKRYRVDRLRVRGLCFHADPTATDLLMFTALCVSPGVSATLTGSTIDVVNEKPNCYSAVVQPLGDMACNRFEFELDCAKLCGLTRQQYMMEVDQYSALISASPARMPLMMIASANDSNAVSKTIRVHLTFEYDCEFFERLVPAQS